MVQRLFIFVFSVFLMCGACQLHGQTLTVKSFNVDDGLAQSAVNDVLKGPQGFYWFATQDGLNRFDGYEFRTFNKTTHAEFKTNYITRLKSLNEESILVGTLNGLYLFNVLNEELKPISPEQQGFGQIHDLLQTENGWLVLEGEKLHLLSHDLFRLSLTQPSSEFTPKPSRSLFTYRGKSFVISKDNQIESVLEQDDIPSELTFINQTNTRTLHYAVEHKEHLWLATNQGVWRIGPQHSVLLLPSLDVANFAIDTKGRFWLSGETGIHFGELPVNQHKALSTRINTDSKQSGVLTARSLLSLYADEDGLVWLGTQNKGVAMHSPKSEWYENHSTASNELTLPSDDVLSISSTGNSLWVATANGVVHFQNYNTFLYRLDSEPSFYSNRITKVKVDEQGTVWLGFNNGGLAYREEGQFRFQSLPLLGKRVQVTDFLRLDNELFVTTREDGLFVVDVLTKIVRHIDKSSGYGLSTDRLQSIHSATGGKIWIGSFDSGVFLWRRDMQQFVHLSQIVSSTPDELDNAIIADLKMIQGRLWIGTTSGLYIVDLENESIERYSAKNGLPNDVIYTLLPDREGNVWLPTNKGIVNFNPRTKQAITYSKKDGFINSEYNANAFAQGDDGRFYVAGIAGLTIFNPKKRPTGMERFQPRLTNVKLFNQELDKTDKPHIWKVKEGVSTLEFEPDMSMFTLFFSAMRPEVSNLIQYRYKMEGFDRQWVNLDSGQNFATYTNLGYGDYLFTLEASVNGVEWSPSKRISVRINPPVWLTLQAKITYVVISLFLILMFVSLWRSKRKVEMASYLQTKNNEQKLKLSMYTSGSVLWDLNLKEKTLRIIDYQQKEPDSTTIPFNESALAKYMHPKDAHIIVKTMETGPYTQEMLGNQYFRFKDQHGQFRWMRGTTIITSFDEDEKPATLLGVSNNIDALKSAQEELKTLNQELEERVISRTRQLNLSNRELKITLDNLQYAQEELLESQKMASLGSMVAGISHEINTPLGICVTAISHLSTQLDFINEKFESKTLTASDFSEFQQESAASFELLDNNIHRAAELIRSFKQVSVDQSSEEKRTFELKSLLEDTVATIAPKFKNRPIEVAVECEKEVELESFPGAVSQIIINLVVNSLTHAFEEDNEGHITITISDILEDYDEILIVYSDDGKGIEESKLSKIFEPFYTSNRSGGSTGLGMHITYNLIVQKLKGAIAINSLPNSGAEFYIRLPLKVK